MNLRILTFGLLLAFTFNAKAQNLKKTKTLAAFKKKESGTRGGVSCYFFYDPVLVENGVKEYVTGNNINLWIGLLNQKRKLYTPFYKNGELAYGEESLPKDFFNETYVGAGLKKVDLGYYGDDYDYSWGCIRDNSEYISAIVLLSKNDEQKFQYKNRFDIEIFYNAFPNSSTENIDYKINQGIQSRIGAEYAWPYELLLKLYPSSSYSAKLQEMITENQIAYNRRQEISRKIREENERKRIAAEESKRRTYSQSNSSNGSSTNIVNECYFEVSNNLEFSDSDSDGSLKVYKPSWKVEYNLSKKGIRLNCSHFNIEYGNKSTVGSGGDNWYFYGCNKSSIKVESQSAAIRKGCEVAYETGNLTSK